MVTDQQVRRLFKLSNTEETQEIAASKAGMDVKTARKYLRARRLPGEMKVERHWRTRKDAFEDVWREVREQLSTNPGLEAQTIFVALQKQYKGSSVFHSDRLLDRPKCDPICTARSGQSRESAAFIIATGGQQRRKRHAWPFSGPVALSVHTAAYWIPDPVSARNQLRSRFRAIHDYL